jgi:tRNA dimethylallyltransferase
VSQPSRPHLLIVVAGQTGAGKSDLALFLASQFSGEIVSCDSIQVYQRLDIGSAKTPLNARRGIPHHLIDIARPDQEVTAGDYQRLGRAVLGEIASRGHCPIVAGGTGFYLRALLEGLSEAPRRSETLRRRLVRIAKCRPTALHRLLSRSDPSAASRIHANDHQKLIRAIEIAALSSLTASAVQSRARPPLEGFHVIKFGLLPSRVALHERLNRRAEQMFAEGLVDETQRLLDSGYGPNLKPLQSLGYKQALDVLSGRLSIGEAVAECQLRTRQYAKRQLTWFRADSEIVWLNGFGFESHIQSTAAARVAEFDTLLKAI